MDFFYHAGLGIDPRNINLVPDGDDITQARPALQPAAQAAYQHPRFSFNMVKP
jgi:hypothetical protein